MKLNPHLCPSCGIAEGFDDSDTFWHSYAALSYQTARVCLQIILLFLVELGDCEGVRRVASGCVSRVINFSLWRRREVGKLVRTCHIAVCTCMSTYAVNTHTQVNYIRHNCLIGWSFKKYNGRTSPKSRSLQKNFMPVKTQNILFMFALIHNWGARDAGCHDV